MKTLMYITKKVYLQLLLNTFPLWVVRQHAVAFDRFQIIVLGKGVQL